MRNDHPITPVAVRVKDVAKIVGLSVREVWRLASSDASFPKPVKMSPRVTVFPYAAVVAWAKARLEAACQ